MNLTIENVLKNAMDGKTVLTVPPSMKLEARQLTQALSVDVLIRVDEARKIATMAPPLTKD